MGKDKKQPGKKPRKARKVKPADLIESIHLHERRTAYWQHRMISHETTLAELNGKLDAARAAVAKELAEIAEAPAKLALMDAELKVYRKQLILISKAPKMDKLKSRRDKLVAKLLELATQMTDAEKAELIGLVQ